MKSMFFGSAAKTMFTIVVVLLVGVAGIAIAYGAGALGGSGGGASPSPTAVASAAVPTAASTPSPGTTTAPADATFVARPVTTGPGIPTAMALSDATLASVGSGWVLTVYDSGTYDAARNPILGTRILYLISPTGDLYDAGAFSASQNVDLAAWNVSQGKALLEFDGGHYAVYNLALGTLGATWSLCGDHPVTAFITARDDGAWGFRGSCVGAQVDGVYDDSGADVTPPDYYRAPFARWDVDLGDGGVAIWQPDSPNLFIVTYPAPSEPVEMHLPTGVDGCRPVGLGRPGTVLASCTSGGAVSAWELDTSGLPPTQVASSSALTFYMAHGGGGGTPYISGNCLVGDMEVLNIQGDVPTSAVVASGTPSSMGYGEELNAQHCWGGTGNTELFSGFGDLWTHTLYGPDVSMIWVTSLGTVADNIGVSLTRSIIVP